MGMFSSDARRDNALSSIVDKLLNNAGEIPKEHFAKAIPALLVAQATSPQAYSLEKVDAAYGRFSELFSIEQRFNILKLLAIFGLRSQGLLFEVWGPVIRNEEDESLKYAASHAALCLSAKESEPTSGGRRLAEFMEREKTTDALNGAFLTCDMRFLPLLQEIWNRLSLKDRKWDAVPVMSLLSVEFLISIIESSECEQEVQTCLNALIEMPAIATSRPPRCFIYSFPPDHPDYSHPQVIDAVTPLPAWKFPSTVPQVMHTWTCPEFLPRFLYRIREKISDEEIEKLNHNWRIAVISS